jgi:cell wall assembly regulator SMI1
MNKIETLWKKFVGWLEENAPELLATMQKGAKEKELEDLEKHLGAALPQDFKTYLRLCNGQESNSEAMFYGGELLSIREIKNVWDIWKEHSTNGVFDQNVAEAGVGVHEVWWDTSWIPFLLTETGDNECIDLNPAKNGTRGQIIKVWHDDQERRVSHKSFTAWLEDLIDQIETGNIVFDREEYNALVRLEDLG